MFRLLSYGFSHFSTLPNHFTPFNQDEFCFSCPFPANFLRSFVKLKTHRRDTRQKFPCFSLCLFVGRVHLSWFCLANFVAYVRFLDRRESVSVAVVFDVNASSKWQLLMVAPTFPQTFPLTRPRPLLPNWTPFLTLLCQAFSSRLTFCLSFCRKIAKWLLLISCKKKRNLFIANAVVAALINVILSNSLITAENSG